MKVRLLSAEKEVFSGEAEAVYARSPEGWFGILSGHAPAAFGLVDSPLRLITASGEVVFQVSSGLVHVGRDEVVILADEVKPGD
jgi:F-type H+-transporting ATPase subunit epsilon